MHTVKHGKLTTMTDALMVAVLAGEVALPDGWMVGVQGGKRVEATQIVTGKGMVTLRTHPPQPLVKAHMIWTQETK